MTYTEPADALARSRRPHAPSAAATYRAAGYWRDITMLDDFVQMVANHPDKAAIVTYRNGRDTPVTLTYRQIDVARRRIARALLDLGVDRDDVVSIQLPNGWEFAAITLAAMSIGAVVNPLVTIFRRRELEFMLNRAGSRVLFVPDTFRGFSHAGLADELLDAVPSLRHAVVVGAAPSVAPTDRRLRFDDTFLRAHPADGAAIAPLLRRPDEIVSLMYTSGTTGEPKGTLHTNNTLWSAGNPLFDSLGLGSEDVAFMASTMGHLTGFLWGMLQPLSRGMKVVFQDVWDPAAFVRIVGEEQVTWTLSATPFVVDTMAAQRNIGADLRSFRFFVCAGAPIPSSLPTEACDVLRARVMALWGTSECGICTIHSPGNTPEQVAASDGYATSVMRVRVVDESGDDVADGTQGRLLTQGPSMFVGYLGRRDLYDAVVDPDGWFDTGDVGYRTHDGAVRISGRTKDIIVRGGENIPVVEIENALFTHPDIAEVAVVGYADDRLGERACAVVVPVGEPPTLSDVTAHLATQGMAKQYWPERLEIRSELPRTPAGKIQKFRLREDLQRDIGRGVFDAPARRPCQH